MAKATGIKIVFNRFPILGAQALMAADKVCRRTAFSIVARSKVLMATTPKTGRIYLKGKKGEIKHQASAPGEAPAVDTSNLINSGFVDPKAAALYECGFSTPYARPLEYGTPTVAARPYLRPSVEEHRAGFDRDIAKAVEGL